MRYVKHNALQGRAEQLTSWQDYQQLASNWRDQVANVRVHQSTRQRPIDRFEQERSCLRKLPGLRFDTDEIVSAIVSSMPASSSMAIAIQRRRRWSASR